MLEEKALRHQITAARQFARVKRGILADDMGLGKTFTSLLWLDYTGLNKFLYTAPKEVTSNLKTEIAKWTDAPIIDIRSKTKAQRQIILSAIKVLDRYIVLVNLEAWSRDKDLLADLIALQLEGIVVDEAHHLSNTKTFLFKGVRELVYAANQCPNCVRSVTPIYKCSRKGCESGGKLNRFRYCMHCGHQQALVSVDDCACGHKIRSSLLSCRSVTYVTVMTGTPIINRPGDLWPLLYLVNDRKFPTQQKYADEYTEIAGPNKTVFKPGAQERLIREIGLQYIQRNRHDAGIRLPPQSVEILEYDQDRKRYAAQWEAYDQIEKLFAIQLEGEFIPLTEIVVQITRLRQMLSWPMGIKIKDEGIAVKQVNVEHSQKLDIVHNKILEYLDCGRRVVAFSHFKAPLRELERRLGDQSVVYDGDTDQATRARIRADFGADHQYPQWSTLLCNYRSAGESLTLVGASDIIVIDPDWSPAKNRQAYARVDRLGQTQETRVHIPRITDTVDIWMAALNDFKESMSSEFNSLANYQSEILRAIRNRR